jgi:hypothetical protein
MASRASTPYHSFPSSLSPGRGKRGRGVGVRGLVETMTDWKIPESSNSYCHPGKARGISHRITREAP